MWQDNTMDDERITFGVVTGQPALNNPSIKRWEARLSLEFKSAQERSFLAKNMHYGPLVLQKSLYPEGKAVCHGVVIHPPGGVAGGDELTLNVVLDECAQVLLTTPGAGKWYKANGLFASQHLNFNLAQAACLEWLPQENILFDGAKVKFSAEVNLAADARYAGWEILCFGRQAQNEVWQTGSLHQALTIRRDDKLIWNERTCLKPEHDLIKSIVGLNGNAVSASFVIAFGAVPAEILMACKAVQPKLSLDMHAKYGVTALPQIFSARYVGQSAQCARQYFEQLWQILRPWYVGREVIRPRIWNT
ncbi:MAG: urease accessory protein UreD [Methylophilus sp.]|nr:urease accessory protein UreD [Methylophilus sp.]